MIDRRPRQRELARPQQLNRTVEICSRFFRRLRRNSAHFLELLHRTVRIPVSHESVNQLQSHGEIRWRYRNHAPQPIDVGACRCPIVFACLQLGERVQHTGIARGISTHLLQQRARIRRATREVVDLRQCQTHFGARRIELSRSIELTLCFLVAARLQVGEAKVRVSQRIVGGEFGELLERRLRLRQLISLQEAECEHAGGVELLHRHLLFSTR